MTPIASGVHAAVATVAYLLTVLVLLVPIVVVAAVGVWWWTGPAARAGMRMRAWRFVRHARRIGS